MYGRKEKKITKDVSLKKAYLKRYASRIKSGKKNTPTFHQWKNASKTERGLMTSGMSKKEISKYKRSKKK